MKGCRKIRQFPLLLSLLLGQLALITPAAAQQRESAQLSAESTQQAQPIVRARALSAKPAGQALASSTRIDTAMSQLQQSRAYQQAAAAVKTGQAQKVQLDLTVSPIPASGEACVCAGGKGSLNGKPVEWPCDCSPAGCGTCGGAAWLSH